MNDYKRVYIMSNENIGAFREIYDFIVEKSEEYINKIEEYKAKEVMGNIALV